MKIKHGVMTALLTLLMSTAAFAESSDEHICRDIGSMTNLGYMDGCELLIECARAEDPTVNYYLAAVCGFDHPGFGVEGHELLKWFTIEADKGDYGSLHYLGDMYQKAIGVPGDLDKALAYYKKAKMHVKESDDKGINRVLDKRDARVKELALQNSCDIRTTEVFGTMLKCSDRNTLDEAIRRSGGILSEAGDAYYKYGSKDLLEGSKSLELFFTNEGRFSCMSYSFGLFKGRAFMEDMVALLTQKYGFHEDYSSITKYRNPATWRLDDGVVITLEKSSFDTTLAYCLPAFENIRLAENEKQKNEALKSKARTQSNAY